jgi:hypothetical protein
MNQSHIYLRKAPTGACGISVDLAAEQSTPTRAAHPLRHQRRMHPLLSAIFASSETSGFTVKIKVCEWLTPFEVPAIVKV